MGKFEIPPKIEEVCFKPEDQLSICEKDNYVDPDSFNSLFDSIIKNPKLFEKYSCLLGYLLNISIEESFVIEDNMDYDLDEDELNKKLEIVLEEYTGKYFNNIFNKYETVSFSEKIKIISFLIDFYESAIFNNNYFSKRKISSFFNKVLEKERGEHGNHYIFLFLNGINNNSKIENVDKISPNQFIVKKWVENKSDDKNSQYSSPNIGRDQLFISDPKDFEEINKLNQSLKKEFSNKVYEEYTSYFNKPLNKEDVIINSNNKENYLDIEFFKNKSIRETFKEKTDFNLEDNNLGEQFSYFEYTKEITNIESDKFYSFAKEYQKDGFRTFLSIEQGDRERGKEMGDKILKLGNPDILPKEIAEKIFKKYGELIDSVENITESLSQKFNVNESLKSNSKLVITENLLHRAKNLLEKYADNLNKKPEEILEEIERIKVDNVLTLSIFQSLRDTNGIKFEDVKDFSFKNESGLSLEEQLEAREIIKKNYKDAPQEAQDAIIESFDNSLKSEDKEVNFPILKNKGKLAAFMRLDFGKYKGTEDYGRKVYFGSFNVDPDFANGEIGSAMIERSVDNIAKTHIVEADCNAEQNIGAKYIESGFTAVGFYDFKGLPGFKIIRDDKLKSRIIGKNLSKEEIILNTAKGFYENDLGKIKIISSSSQKELLTNFKEELDGSKIISRYFYDKNGKQWIAVIENNVFSKELE